MASHVMAVVGIRCNILPRARGVHKMLDKSPADSHLLPHASYGTTGKQHELFKFQCLVTFCRRAIIKTK